ncbi:CBS domain-containing protein [Paenibacillus montaniterrae]|uniref:CBS domain-containing protein n=1 Tax=Paenibacillus montaniterrae TaxID=429341 RepID=A0A919YNM3_9BACL|nr:CBS domain-containing protein [Paenibacillus montaniterrae]GIP16540.1 CBS domain-containing protein [Paenibacillus montaniterrae]
MKQVQDIMTKDCLTVTPQDNIFQVAELMAKNEIGFVPVVDEQDHTKLVGVVTDRDLVRRGYAAKRPGSTEIREVMSDQLVITTPQESIAEAADLMAHYQVRRLPVVDQGKLVGVIALGDLSLNEIPNTSHALHDISEQENHLLQ